MPTVDSNCVYNITEIKENILHRLIQLRFKNNKKLRRMLSDIVGSYKNTLMYHNIYHVYDVCENIINIYEKIKTKLNIKNRTNPHIMSIFRLLYFCSLCHDICHSGESNLKTIQSELDLQKIPEYLDSMPIKSKVSSNENIHVYTTLKLYEKYFNCLNFKTISYEYGVLFLNNIILSTDIGLHKCIYPRIKDLQCISLDSLTKYPITYSCLFLKVSDLCHLTKEFYIHSDWVFRLFAEQNISFDNVSYVSKDTINFINIFVKPMFETIDKVLETKDNLSYSIRLNDNYAIWKSYSEYEISSKIDNTNIIDSFSLNASMDEYIFTTHENVCICMIDISNFSQWCSKQKPIDIFKTMTEFNVFLNERIAKYSNIEKIELVGDSVMIVGGLYPINDVRVYTQNIVELCYDILVDIHKIKNMFNDELISLRIGVHNGDVYSGFIYNPKKYQLFGNSINVASRLESGSLPGVMNMSSKTYSIIKNSDVLNKFHIGKTNSSTLKGIGVFESKWCFIYINKVLIADDVLTTCVIIEKNLRNILPNGKSCLIENDDKKLFKLLRQYKYDCIFLDRHFDANDVLINLKEFRIWETKYCSSPQKIFLITSMEGYKTDEYLRLYVDDIIDKDNEFIKSIKQIFI